MGVVQLTVVFIIAWNIAFSGTPKRDLHSSCFDLEDGSHYLQILTNEELSILSSSDNRDYLTAPIVHVWCHSGYTIIDPSFDNEWISYFTSFHEWTVDAAGPDLDDHVTWNQWFIPSALFGANDITYSISPDCKQCIAAKDNEYNNKVYYMSGDIFSCYWPLNNDMMTKDNILNQCIVDENGYSQCMKCHINDIDKMYYSSNCPTMIYDANTPIFNDHQRCMEDLQSNKLPSIGTNGEYCICYKPSTRTGLKPANWGNHYGIDSWDELDADSFDNEKEKELNDIENEEEEEEEEEDGKAVNIELYQTDFEDGTYRIRKPGTYTIMENIKFNFNPGGTKHPNAPYSWMPSENQEEEYPGASKINHDDYYSMGFFAGITVETDDVIIDLNGYSMGMEYLFYLQQRFFICISLTNKVFADGEGITFMGIGQKSANNVEIKNGIIGLTSHIGIFGINIHNIHLLNLHIRDFEIYGVAMDQFKRFTMKNIEIGPSINGQLKVNKRYTMSRLMLPTFYSVLKENPKATVSFYKRGIMSIQDIIDRLILRMDLAFEYAVNGLDRIDIQSNEWKEAKELFVVDDGVSQHNTIYGLALRPKKGQKEDDPDSAVAVIDGLYIHDLIINPKQVIKIGITSDLWLRNAFKAPIDLSIAIKKPRNGEEEDLDEIIDINDAIYYGDVYTDGLMAVRQLTDSWWLLGGTIIWPQFIQWTQSGDPLKTYFEDDIDNTIKQICGYDDVSGVSKGVIGLHIAYSYDIQITHIKIENLVNMASFGHNNCDYFGNNYQGNHAKAISIYKGDNIDIDELTVTNIVSFTGPVYGVYIDKNKEAEITLKYATFSHIDAGIKGMYDGIDMSKDIGHNLAASSCSVYCEDNYCDNIEYYDIEEQCMNGHLYCNQFNQMMIHHGCTVGARYETPIGIIYINKNGDIEAELIKPINNTPKYISIIFKGAYFAVAIVIVLAILAVIKCIYFSKNQQKTTQRTDEDENETNPLISDNNDNILYNSL